MDNRDDGLRGRFTAGCLAILFAIAFVVGAGAILRICAHRVVDLIDTVHARVDFVPVDATIDRASVHSSHPTSGRRSQRIYKPAIVYSFSLQGQPGFGTEIAPYEFESSDYDEIERFVASHPPGTQIEAWVDPTDPSRSYMRVDFGLYPFGEFLLLGPLLVLAVAIFWILIWLAWISWRYRGLSDHERFLIDHRIIDEPDRLWVRVGSYPTWRWIVVGWVAASLAAGIATTVTVGHRVPFWVVAGVWLIGLVVGGLLLRIKRRGLPLEACWLGIDRTTRRFEVLGESMDVGEIEDVVIVETASRSDPPRYRLAVRVGGGRLVRFGDTSTKRETFHQLRDYLREQLWERGPGRDSADTAAPLDFTPSSDSPLA